MDIGRMDTVFLITATLHYPLFKVQFYLKKQTF